MLSDRSRGTLPAPHPSRFRRYLGEALRNYWGVGFMVMFGALVLLS